MNINLKGGALLFALAILLIASILISLFLSLDLSYTKLTRKFTEYQQGVNKLDEGVKLGYYLNSEKYEGKQEENTQHLTINKKLWGCYFLVSTEVKLDSSSSLSKVGLIGNQLKKDYCLYLADRNTQLSLSGNTLLEGNCFLPEKGAGISYVEGKSYLRKKLVNGKVMKSNSSLPEVNPFLIQQNVLFLKGIFSPTQDSIVPLNELVTTEINQSFFNKTLVIMANSPLVLDASWGLKGNIIVHSNSTITVRSGVTLDNVILSAKNILLQNNVEACAQLIGKEAITLDSNSHLTYPSSVLTIGDSSSIHLLGDASINGSLISYSQSSNSFNTISLSKNSQVTGLVYCTNRTEVKGKINGKLITQKLFYRSPSTEYTNTLIDAEINNSTLPDFYSCAPLLEEKSPQINVIQWLK